MEGGGGVGPVCPKYQRRQDNGSGNLDHEKTKLSFNLEIDSWFPSVLIVNVLFLLRPLTSITQV